MKNLLFSLLLLFPFIASAQYAEVSQFHYERDPSEKYFPNFYFMEDHGDGVLKSGWNDLTEQGYSKAIKEAVSLIGPDCKYVSVDWVGCHVYLERDEDGWVIQFDQQRIPFYALEDAKIYLLGFLIEIL